MGARMLRKESIMEDIKRIATRESFGRSLAELEDENIVVLDADLDTSTKTEYFKERHPERFVELGIAEADMIGTAAGLATAGKIPFAATFAAFATGRCYDQIRTSIAYPNLNVKICGTHAGLTVGEDGATHQMLEDINLMRGLPNMTVISTSDDVQTRKIVKKIAEMQGPVYLRLSRQKTPVIYDEDAEFEIGKAVKFGEDENAKVAVFATGVTVSEALKAKENLKKVGIDIIVVDMHTIKPIDKDIIKECSLKCSMLVSVEDHSIIGGLGSAIAEVLTGLPDEAGYCKRLVRLGAQDVFGKSGKPEELMKYYAIDSEMIEKVVKRAIEI